MNFENPLEEIKKKNREIVARKNLEASKVVEQEKINQENIDTEYNLAVDEKEVYSKQIIDIKNRISEISGTQEEMIAEYRNIINEAKKVWDGKYKKDENGEYLLNKKGEKIKEFEALEFLRNNFKEVFAAGI